MKEIGGYIELDKFRGNMLYADYPDVHLLSCGRSCIKYLIHANKIKKIYLPRFICDSVYQTFRDEHVEIEYYSIGVDWLPKRHFPLNEYIYLVNYYGQISNDTIKKYKNRYPNLIVDNTQAYFQKPVEHIDTLYSCRKFFGVVGGGILFPDIGLEAEHIIPRIEAWNRMEYILGRYERNASEFYRQASANNDFFNNRPIEKMSYITENILHGVDYKFIKNRRTDNFRYLHSNLKGNNTLLVREVTGAFAYPFMSSKAEQIRKQLLKNKIYVPILWPSVLKDNECGTLEYTLANNVLPIPCDQRYDKEDMETICKYIL